MAALSHRRAIASIVVAGLLTSACIVAVISFNRRGRDEDDVAAERSEVAGDWLHFDKLNFQFERPENRWNQVDPQQIHPDAALAFVAGQGEIAFLILAERPGVEQQVDLQSMKEMLLSNHKSIWEEVELQSDQPETHAGIPGKRLVFTTGGAEQPLKYVSWLGVHQGYVYQLQVFSNQADDTALDRAADELFARFTLFDPQRVAHSDEVIEDFQSARHGYVLRLGGTRWQPWRTVRDVLPAAEFGALIGNYARCAVIPVSFLGRAPRLEAVTQALLARLQLPFSPSSAQNYERLPDVEGNRFELSHKIEDRTYHYHFQVVQRDGRGFLVAAWADEAAPKATDELLSEAIDRFELSTTARPAPKSAGELTIEEQRTHAQLFNDLGLYHFNTRLFAESADYFRQAFEFFENDPVLLDNLVNAYIELNQFQQARNYLARHVSRFPDHLELKARLAFVQANAGDRAAAIKTYAELFAGGFRSDDAFQDYIQLLADNRRIDEALAQVNQYLARGASAAASRLQAMLYARKGEYAQAVVLLTKLRADGPFDPELAYDLADTHLAAQQFHEGLAVCRELLDRRYDTAYTYLLKGRLELGLKWYAAAKISFEAALRQDPSNESTQVFLDQVSGMLGEGNNSSIKDPIDPVPIPSVVAALADANKADGYQDQYGACYLQRIEAVAFDAGKELKTTTRQVVRLFDSSGVTRFSTFQFEFDPLAQQLYVNSLRVSDATGKEVAFGKPSDYYVIDDGADGVASGRKLLNVPVPGLKPGCTVELVFTRRDLVPPAHFPFTEHYFTADVPIVRDCVYVQAPQAEVLARASQGLSPVKCEADQGPDRETADGMTWIVNDPPVYRFEPMQAPLEAFVPHLLLGSPAQNWSQLAKEYLQSIDDQLQIEPSTRTLAEQTTTGAANDGEKTAALVRLVRDQLSYRAIEFGRRARVPNKASTILANRYGDCKDHSLLLMQLLQATGIDAHLALVRLDHTPEESLPSLDQFDHMITYVPRLAAKSPGDPEASRDAGRFFDCTDKETPFDQVVPRGLAGRPAFVLDPENPRFVTLPAYPADSNLADSERRLRLVNDADLAIEETLRLEGYVAATLRGLLKDVQPANRVAVLQTQLSAAAGGPLQLQKVEVENLEDQSAPLVVKTDCLVKGKFHTVGESLVGQIPAVWERFFLNAQRVENRQTPFVARYPLRVKSSITLGLPEGFTTGDMGPLNQEEQSSFAEWKMSAEGGDEAVRVEFQASRGVGQYSPEQYGAYCDSIDRTVAALAQNVVLKRVQK